MVGGNGANFATCVAFFVSTKMPFFEGCPVGWGGYPPELAVPENQGRVRFWEGRWSPQVRNVSYNAHKKKMVFFEGWEYPPELAWWTGG